MLEEFWWERVEGGRGDGGQMTWLGTMARKGICMHGRGRLTANEAGPPGICRVCIRAKCPFRYSKSVRAHPFPPPIACRVSLCSPVRILGSSPLFPLFLYIHIYLTTQYQVQLATSVGALHASSARRGLASRKTSRSHH